MLPIVHLHLVIDGLQGYGFEWMHIGPFLLHVRLKNQNTVPSAPNAGMTVDQSQSLKPSHSSGSIVEPEPQGTCTCGCSTYIHQVYTSVSLANPVLLPVLSLTGMLAGMLAGQLGKRPLENTGGNLHVPSDTVCKPLWCNCVLLQINQPAGYRCISVSVTLLLC